MPTVTVGQLEAILALKDSMSPAIKAAESTVGKFGSVVGSVFSAVASAAAVVGSAIVALGGAIVALGSRGADVLDVEAQFRILNDRIGNTGDVLGKLRTAFDGTISNFEIMEATNKGLSLGLKVTAEDLELTAKSARVLSDRGFGPAKEVYETLILAMGRGQDRLAKQVGLDTDAAIAVEKHAKSLGVEVKSLGEAEKKLAVRNALLAEMGQVLKVSGEAETDFADIVSKAKSSMQNMLDQIAKVIASSPALIGLVRTAAEGFEFLADWVQRNDQGIRAFVSGALQFLSKGIGFTIGALVQLNNVFAFAREAALAYMGNITKLAFGLEFLAKAASSPLSAASAFKDLTAKLKGTDVVISAMRDNVEKQRVGFDGLLTKAASLNAKFGELAKQTGEVTTKGKAHVPVVEAQAAALGKAAKEANKLFEAFEKEQLRAVMEAEEEAIKKAADQLDRMADEMTRVSKEADEADLAQMAAESAESFRRAAEELKGMGKELKFGKALGMAFKVAWKDALGGLPEVILGALQGGGDVGKSIGAHFGGSIASGIAPVLTSGLSSLLGKGIGSALGSAIPGIGTVLGGVLGDLGGKLLGSIFGGKDKEVNKLRDQFIASAGGVEALRKKALEAGVSLDALFGAKDSRKGLESAIAQVTKGFGEWNKAQALIGQSQEALNDAVKRYGFEVSELGPLMQQQELDKMAQGLLQDWNLLNAAKIDAVAILERMAPAMNEYVHTAVASGAAIPEAMRGQIEKMLEMGLLLDESGNAFGSLAEAGITFTQTLSEGLRQAVEEIRNLVAALTGNIRVPPIHVPVIEDRSGGGGGEIIEAAAGFNSMVRRPTRFLAGERGPEHVRITPQGPAGHGGGSSAGGGPAGGGDVRELILVVNENRIGSLMVDLQKSGRFRVQ